MLWRILSKTSLIYCSRTFEVFSAMLFIFFIVVFYGEAITIGELPQEGEVPIYVRSNGVHTELILPSESLEMNWKEFIATEDFGDSIVSDFIVMGWGDKGFYMNTPKWSDLTAKTALSALLIPTSTAMHVTYRGIPEEGNDCIKLTITRSQYHDICSYVKESFRTEKNRADLIPGKGYGISDNFYEANSSYHLFRTCNTWTSNALHEAGIRSSVLAVFPNAVMGHFRN